MQRLPDSHVGSALAAFTQEALGFTSGGESRYGIQFSNSVIGARDPAEPGYRAWRDGLYYPLAEDEKRPWCRLLSGTCRFDEWVAGESRFDTRSTRHRVPLTYERHTAMPGTGLLSAEAPRYLRFMQEYYVGGTVYGRRRYETSSGTAVHTGSLARRNRYVPSSSASSLAASGRLAEGFGTSLSTMRTRRFVSRLSPKPAPAKSSSAVIREL